MNTIFARARAEFEAGRFSDAITLYESAKRQSPHLTEMIDQLIGIARSRLDKGVMPSKLMVGGVPQAAFARSAATAEPLSTLGGPRPQFQSLQVGVVILSLNGAALLDRLFESIKQHAPTVSYGLFVTDHGSTDKTREVIERWQSELPIHTNYAAENYTFSYSNNRWAEALGGCKYLLFLNNDIIFEEDVIGRMSAVMADPSIGVVGIEQLDPPIPGQERTWHHCGIGFNWDAEYNFWRPINIRQRPSAAGYLRDMPAVTGSVMMLRRQDFLAVGGFDEKYIYGYEDVDLCLKIRHSLGKRSVCLLSDKVIHADGVTRAKVERAEVKRRRINNLEVLRDNFNSYIGRLMRAQLVGVTESYRRPVVAFAVTEVGEAASAGDLFTANELGDALRREFGWEVRYLPKGDGWYDLAGVDVLVAMVDAYDVRRIKNNHPSLLRVGWARNWFDRWCDREWSDGYDLYLASSVLAADYIEKRTGQPARLLRIAANVERFNVTGRAPVAKWDYIFTGSYWNAERDICHALAGVPPNCSGAIFGKNWEKVPALAPIAQGFVNYGDLPKIYRQASVVIDDANHVTKPWGSVNSRVFDAIAAGCLVITNSETASRDAFDGLLPTYRDGAELSKLVQHYKSSPEERLELVEKLRAHVISRHSYTRRAFEFLEHLRDVSNSSVRYAIKIPVPRREVAAEWGDFHFAVALAKGLRQAGNSARIDFLPEWARGGGEGDDVSIVLRGLSKFDTARSKTVNIQWLISHPDKVDVEELNAYDLVFVASEKHAVKLARQCAKPVRVLLQCTDVERFLPATNEALDGVGSDLLFVGNSRNQYRKIIRDALEMGLRPEVYGARWEQFIPAEFIRGNNLPNELLPRSYQAARVVLNDHWEDMAKGGFLSNRLFDVVAAGGVAVSDRCDGLESIFEGAVVTYADPEELPAAVQRAGAIRRDSPDYLAAHLRIRSQHSFLARAREIDAASRQLIGYF